MKEPENEWVSCHSKSLSKMVKLYWTIMWHLAYVMSKTDGVSDYIFKKLGWDFSHESSDNDW